MSPESAPLKHVADRWEVIAVVSGQRAPYEDQHEVRQRASDDAVRELPKEMAARLQMTHELIDGLFRLANLMDDYQDAGGVGEAVQSQSC